MSHQNDAFMDLSGGIDKQNFVSEIVVTDSPVSTANAPCAPVETIIITDRI